MRCRDARPKGVSTSSLSSPQREMTAPWSLIRISSREKKRREPGKPSRRGTASQWPFWSRPATGRHLNGHFGLVMRHDGVSMAILVSSCGMTASQWSFWSRHATRRRLNGHFGLVMRHDGVSTAILISSCDTTASQWSFWSRHAAGNHRLGHSSSTL